MGLIGNTIRFTLLLSMLFGIFLALGYYFGGTSGMTFAFMLAFFMNFLAYWYSDRIVLAMYSAKPYRNARIETILKKLSKEAGIAVPKLYMVDSPQPNAFATGRSKKKCAVAVTKGLVELLDDDEIEGVLSHEIAHIRNRDILLSTIAATVAAAISYIAEMLWWSSVFGDEREARSLWVVLPVIILAPLAATLIQLAISRGREFLADETGAKLSRKPHALASALKKISAYASHMPMDRGSAATAHMWIVNPFKAGLLTKLFSTHPPVEERIKRLEALVL